MLNTIHGHVYAAYADCHAYMYITNFAVGSRRYRFTRLPMGLATSPRFLQATLEEVLAPLRSVASLLWVHVDDVLLVAQESTIKNLTEKIIRLIDNAGFVINIKKSILIPTQQLNYVGLRLNFRARVFAPSDKHLFTMLRSLPLFSAPSITDKQ